MCKGIINSFSLVQLAELRKYRAKVKEWIDLIECDLCVHQLTREIHLAQAQEIPMEKHSLDSNTIIIDNFQFSILFNFRSR